MLKQPLAALNETLDAFEAGLAVDASEVRAQSTEALRHLLPICSLLQPTQDIGTDGAPSAPAPSANTSSAAPATVDAELEALKAKAADAVKLAASAADPPADAAESTADEVAAKLADVSVTIEGKANEEGHLFGSVNASQVAAALREKDVSVDDKMVRLDNPLKEIGVYDVTVHLHAEVEAVIKVWVVQQKPE